MVSVRQHQGLNPRKDLRLGKLPQVGVVERLQVQQVGEAGVWQRGELVVAQIPENIDRRERGEVVRRLRTGLRSVGRVGTCPGEFRIFCYPRGLCNDFFFIQGYWRKAVFVQISTYST